jgi:hypothetical protein
MAIGKDLGFHDHRFTDNTFDRKSPAIDLGPDALNGDAATPVNLLAWHVLEPPRRRTPVTRGTARSARQTTVARVSQIRCGNAVFVLMFSPLAWLLGW